MTDIWDVRYIFWGIPLGYLVGLGSYGFATWLLLGVLMDLYIHHQIRKEAM